MSGYLAENNDDEISELITIVYYASTGLLEDVELAKIISGHFLKKMSKSKVNVSSAQEAEDLKTVKQIVDAKKEK